MSRFKDGLKKLMLRKYEVTTGIVLTTNPGDGKPNEDVVIQSVSGHIEAYTRAQAIKIHRELVHKALKYTSECKRAK